MFDAVARARWTLTVPLELWRRRLVRHVARAGRAWRYLAGRLTAADAQQIIRDCHSPAGWHPLMVLRVDDVLARARRTFADHPDLPRLVAEACLHVERRWCSYKDDLEQAREWALDLVQRYAPDDGIVLERRGSDGGMT
jgi:hypothetical protein